MELERLFEAQKVLRDRIAYNEPDRFNKLILALLVELGECANEQRSWKYWSKDQQPRKNNRIKCPTCNGNGMVAIGEGVRGVKKCPDCDNRGGGVKTVNPLLEEFVDGLHFVLELGIELKYWPAGSLPGIYPKEITSQFTELYYIISGLSSTYESFGRGERVWEHYQELFDYYLFLGKSLGFTWEQIEQSYFEKNRINHERQDNGY